MKLWQSVFLKRLFVSYVVILIPTFAIFFAVTDTIFANQRVLLDAGAENELQIAQAQLESDLQGLRLQCINLSLKDELSKSRVYQNGSDARKAIEYLSDINRSSRLVYDIFLWYGDDVVYTSKGMCRYSTMTGNLRLSSENIALLQDWLEESSCALHLLHLTENSGYILFHIPISADSQFASINILLKLGEIGYKFSHFFQKYEGTVVLSLKNAHSVFWKYENSAITQSIQTFSSEENEIVISGFTTSYGTQISAHIPESLLYDQLKSTKNTFLWILIILLLLVLGISLVFSRHNAYPLHRMAESVVGSSDGHVDEINTIEHLIQMMTLENKTMRATVQNERRQLMEQTMLLLLHGVTMTSSMVQGVMEMNGKELHEKCFAVALLFPESKEELRALSARMRGEISCQVQFSKEKALAILVQLPSIDTNHIRQAFARQIAEICQKSEISMPVLCISRPCEALEQIHQAYLEAMFAYQFAKFRPSERVILFEDLTTTPLPPSMHFHSEDIQALNEALEAFNGKQMEKCLRKLLSSIQEMEEMPEIQTLMRCQLLQFALLQIMQMDMDSETYEELYSLDPSREEPFSQRLLQLLKSACSSGQGDALLFGQATAYLENHYTDQNLSLEELAQHLGQPKTSISKLFRSQSGKRYIDYLSDLRMKKAAELLKQSDFQIKEITQMVGYWDAVSFQKKFKQMFGLNPSEYRMNQQKKENES